MKIICNKLYKLFFVFMLTVFVQAGAMLAPCYDVVFPAVLSLQYIIKKFRLNCCKNDLERVCKCIIYGYTDDFSKEDINKKYDFLATGNSFSKFTPLHYACFTGDFELVKKLISLGADKEAAVDGCDNCYLGVRPIHIAVRRGKKKIIRLLLKEGVDIKTLDGHARGLMLIAAMKKEPEIIISLLRAIARQDDVIGTMGRGALQIAASRGNLGVVKGLLEAGICEGKDEAMRIAARKGYSGIVKLFLEVGTDITGFLNRDAGGVFWLSEQIRKINPQGRSLGKTLRLSVRHEDILRLLVLAKECDDIFSSVDSRLDLSLADKIISKIDFIMRKCTELNGGQALTIVDGVAWNEAQNHFALVLSRMLSKAIEAEDFWLVKYIMESGFTHRIDIFSTQIIICIAKAIKEKDIKPFNGSMFKKIFDSTFNIAQVSQSQSKGAFDFMLRALGLKNSLDIHRQLEGKNFILQMFGLKNGFDTFGRFAGTKFILDEWKDCAKFVKKVATVKSICVKNNFDEDEKMQDLLGSRLNDNLLSDCEVIVS